MKGCALELSMSELAASTDKRLGIRRAKVIAVLATLTAVVTLSILAECDNRAADWIWGHTTRALMVEHLADKLCSDDPGRSSEARDALLSIRTETDVYTLIHYVGKHPRDQKLADRLCDVLAGVGEPAFMPLFRTARAEEATNDALWATIYGSAPRFEQVQRRALTVAQEPHIAMLGLSRAAMSKMGRPAIRPAVQCLSASAPSGDQWEALQVLANVSDPEAVKPIIALLNSAASGQVRAWALHTLSQQRSPLAAETFVAELKPWGPPSASSPETAQIAAVGLGRLKDPRARDWLIEIVTEGKYPTLQDEAMEALGRYSGPDVEALLIKVVQDDAWPDNWEKRLTAARALRMIGTPTAKKAVSDAGMDRAVDDSPE
jgi:hypothetical protein